MAVVLESTQVVSASNSLTSNLITIAAGDIIFVACAGGRKSTGIPDNNGADRPKLQNTAVTSFVNFNLIGYEPSAGPDARLSVYYHTVDATDVSNGRTTVSTGSGWAGQGNKMHISRVSGGTVTIGAEGTGWAGTNSSGNITWTNPTTIASGSGNVAQFGWVSYARNTTYSSPAPTTFAFEGQLSGTGGDGALGLMCNEDVLGTSLVTGVACSATGGREWSSIQVCFRAAAGGTTAGTANASATFASPSSSAAADKSHEE